MKAPISCFINNEGEKLIDNIVANFKASPIYSNYKINKYFDDGCTYILICDSYGRAINRFSFYGTFGKITSIAIYGSQLQGHFHAIKSSMKIFGLPVKNVSWEDTFIDVYLFQS